jgi:hypothetical protein
MEVNAFSPGDDQELLLPEGLHLGEGMPEVIPVPLDQGVVVIVHDYLRILSLGVKGPAPFS